MQPPMVSYYDQSSILMNARTGTPMRLVSPAPVMVPPGAQRAPQAPQIYPPPPQSAQQNMYSSQNGNGVGGNYKCIYKSYTIYKLTNISNDNPWTYELTSNGCTIYRIFIVTTFCPEMLPLIIHVDFCN